MEQRARVTNAFQVGLVGGLGVLTAILIGAAVTQTATILTYIGIALFIALGMERLQVYLKAISLLLLLKEKKTIFTSHMKQT